MEIDSLKGNGSSELGKECCFLLNYWCIQIPNSNCVVKTIGWEDGSGSFSICLCFDHGNNGNNRDGKKAEFIFCKVKFTYLLTQNGKRALEKYSVTWWKLGSLFCQFISVLQAWLWGPITMETIMWGNWQQSTLQISLEYITRCKGPTLLTFSLLLLSLS